MRKISLLIIIALFLANMATVTAWAKPCMHDMDHAAAAHHEQSMKDMPCCDDEQAPAESTPCKTICYNAALNQVPVIKEISFLTPPSVAAAQPVWALDDKPASLTSPPPRKPPKSLS